MSYYQEEEEEKLPYKKVKYNEQEDEDQEYDEEDLLQAIAEAENDENLAFDQESLLKLINQFEKHIIKNGQLRSQFANKPDKFMESEIELDEDIKKFYHITAYPELIVIFYKSNAIQNMVQLLQHENNDIRAETIGFLKDFVQIEFEKAEDEQYQKDIDLVIRKFIDNSLLEGLQQNLEKFREHVQEEYEYVFKILEIFEALMEQSTTYINLVCDKTTLLAWITERLALNIKSRVIDDNKLYCAEILTLALSTPENQYKFRQLTGMDKLIEALSKFKSQDPGSEEEKEYVMNIFASIQILLIDRQSQEEFRSKLGIDLMLKMIKEKKFCSRPALKTLMYSILNNDVSCNYIVEVQGLKYLLPIVVMKGIKSKKEEEQKLINEQIFSIISSLFKGTKGLNQERVANKFRESDFEKIDRLFELHNYYFSYVNEIDRRMTNPAFMKQLMEDEEMTEKEVRETIYMKKQEIGLNILESIDYIIMVLCTWKDEDIAQQVKKIFGRHESTKEEVIKTIQEQVDNMNPEDSQDEIDRNKKLLQQLQN